MISTTMLGDFLILLVFVPYMNILLYMVQILSLLQLNLLIFVPYLQFFLCMVQISSFLHFNLLIFVPYTHFLLRMVQIPSFLLFNLPIFVPYTHFLLRMVQISSFLLINLLISVPSIHFLAYMVQIQGFHDNYSAYTTTFSIILWYIFNLCQPVSCLFLYESTILYHNNCNIHTNLWCKLFYANHIITYFV